MVYLGSRKDPHLSLWVSVYCFLSGVLNQSDMRSLPAEASQKSLAEEISKQILETWCGYRFAEDRPGAIREEPWSRTY